MTVGTFQLTAGSKKAQNGEMTHLIQSEILFIVVFIFNNMLTFLSFQKLLYRLLDCRMPGCPKFEADAGRTMGVEGLGCPHLLIKLLV